jgi:hypothetical protein
LGRWGLGEKVLQQFKLLWIGFRTSWQENTLEDIYQRGEIIIIKNELKKETNSAGPKMFHIYSDYITATVITSQREIHLVYPCYLFEN